MINVIGLGYIGLPTALMLAKKGAKVVGSDINQDVVSSLKDGSAFFSEEEINELFKEVYKKIDFKSEYEVADRYIVAVPTPFDRDTKKVDPKYIVKAVEEIVEVCKDDTIIIIESTVSPGTIDKFIRPIVDSSDKKIHLAHAPERILPTNIVYELVNNSRTIGADDKKVLDEVERIYSSFCKGEIFKTSIKVAEMTKVVENTYRDINIAFANELAQICDLSGLDVYEVIKIANKHPRVNILNPGPGVGGHCISVDPWFLVGDFPKQTRLINSARYVNDSMPLYVKNKLNSIMIDEGITDYSRVGIYGLTYKGNVDDVRESPSMQFLSILKEEDRDKIVVYDPYIKKMMYRTQVFDFQDFLNSCDIVLIMVDHEEIKNSTNVSKLESKVVFDTKHIGENLKNKAKVYYSL